MLGKVPGDDVKLSVLSLKPSMKIMMMGTREENLVIHFFHFFIVFVCAMKLKLIAW